MNRSNTKLINLLRRSRGTPTRSDNQNATLLTMFNSGKKNQIGNVRAVNPSNNKSPSNLNAVVSRLNAHIAKLNST